MLLLQSRTGENGHLRAQGQRPHARSVAARMDEKETCIEDIEALEPEPQTWPNICAYVSFDSGQGWSRKSRVWHFLFTLLIYSKATV